MQKTLKIFILLSLVSCVIFIFIHKGPLEGMPIGQFEVSSNSKLSIVCAKLEQEINKRGGDWRVHVDADIAEMVSKEHVFSSGNALIACWDIQNKFKCKTITIKKDRLIIFYSNGSVNQNSTSQP